MNRFYPVKKFLLLFLTIFFVLNSECFARMPYPEQGDSLRVGLVLSGGGARGIAHIGIIEAIEDAGIRIDYITGTSMGALAGAFYSVGYTTEQLREIALSSDFRDLFAEPRLRDYTSNYEKVFDERALVSFPVNRRSIGLPIGVISGQDIYSYLSRLTWHAHDIRNFDEFPIPFAAIGTHLETGEAKVFRSGYLPDALRASMSIPSFFAPHEIDGQLYVDGGLIRNLPVEDAIELGANYIIAVDVGSKLQDQNELTSLTSILNQVLHFRIVDNVNIQKEMADYYLEVEGLEQFSSSDFDKAKEILELGVRAGKQHADRFEEIAGMQSGLRPIRLEVPEPQSLPIREIVIEGNTIYDDQFIRELLDFTPGTAIEPDVIEQNVTRLYSSRYIDNVLYQVEPAGDEYILRLSIRENIEDRFSLGVRYEGSSKASILLNLTLQNVFDTESIARFEARLGERMHFKAEHVYYSLFDSRSAFLTSVEYQSENVEWYADGDRIAVHENEIFRGELSWANFFSTNNLFSVGLRKDFTFHRNRINRDDVRAPSEDYHAFFVRYMRDNLNRKSFPVRGRKLVFETFLSDPVILSPIAFTASRFYYRGNHRLGDSLTFRNTLLLGYTTGNDLPWGYWNSLNRYEPYFDMIRFGGASRHELNSRNVQMVSAGLQAELTRDWFLGLDLYAGRFMENWNIDPETDKPEKAISISIGNLTLLGPVELIFSHSSLNRFHMELQVGYVF
jgi:NTE family protein